jgi:F-type H+-transporting ATPase subunit b
LTFAAVLLAETSKNPILPETNELVYSIISFVVLCVLFKMFGYPAVKKSMDNRTQRIRNNLDEAERAKDEAASILAEYQRQLADAKTESNRIIEEARRQAEEVKKELVTQTQAEVNAMKARAAEDIKAAQARAAADLQARIGELVVDLAEKVIERNLDRETNIAMINRYIEEVGAST